MATKICSTKETTLTFTLAQSTCSTWPMRI
jgi:hypothetical protein